MRSFFDQVDVAFMGRKTYEAAKKMGKMGGDFSGWKMEFYVFSKTLPEGGAGGCEVCE